MKTTITDLLWVRMPSGTWRLFCRYVDPQGHNAQSIMLPGTGGGRTHRAG